MRYAPSDTRGLYEGSEWKGFSSAVYVRALSAVRVLHLGAFIFFWHADPEKKNVKPDF